MDEASKEFENLIGSQPPPSIVYWNISLDPSLVYQVID